VQSDRYLYGAGTDQILADEKPSGAVQWALTDNQGTVRDVIDSNGDLVNHITYDSFGNITSQSDPTAYFRFGYTGREVDSETGLMYYRSRYFDGTNGRFISEDAIGFIAGDVNLYRYVLNSPLNFVDPSGHNFEDFINQGINRIDNALSDRGVDLRGVVNSFDQGVGGFSSGATGGLSDIARQGIYGNGVNDNQQGLLHDISSGLGDAASNAVGGAAAKGGGKLLKYGAGFVRRANDVADKYEKGKSAYDIARGCGDLEDLKNVAGGVAPFGKNSGKPQVNGIRENANPSSLSPRQTPSEMSGSKVKRLKKGMKANGYDSSEPIEVVEIDGKLIIHDGHHRREAARQAGIREVPIQKIEVSEEQKTQYAIQAAEAAEYRR
jgi:RHS repeat-associated protein